MRLGALGSRIGRRMVAAFLLCAIVPTLGAGLVCYLQVSEEVRTQTTNRLRHAAHTLGITLYERLRALDFELEAVAHDLGGLSRQELPTWSRGRRERLGLGFEGIELRDAGDRSDLLVGALRPLPVLGEDERDHLDQGHSLLHLRLLSEGPEVWLIRPIAIGARAGSRLYARLRTEHLWRTADDNNLPVGAEFCVVAPSGAVLECSRSARPERNEFAPVLANVSGNVEFTHLERGMIGRFHSVFLRPAYLLPRLGVVVGEPRDQVWRPLARFQRGLAFVIGLALCLVASLSLRQIRASLVPLERLLAGTKRIAAQEFEARVEIRGEDEFTELASSFNDMVQRISAHREVLRSTNKDLAAANDRLRAARDEAEAANRAKTRFLTNMSHELRTPMTAILGYSDLLLEADAREWRAHAETIQRNGAHLLKLLDDLLDISSLDAGRLEIRRQVCAPVELVNGVLSAARASADEKGLALTVEYADPLPCIETDPIRLRQILGNLISNAIKFTSEGGVQVVVKFEPVTADSSASLHVTVRDTGIGIDPARIGQLFEVFSQEDDSLTRRFGGAGIGLAVSHRMAERLGGRLTVSSLPGDGSTFELWIDAGRPSTPQASLAAGRGGRVLLVEDSPDNQRLIRAFLTKAGFELELAENGLIGCEKVLAAAESDLTFDVVLMDMQMPVLDGYEATRRLRVSGYEGIIVALTAHAMEGDRERCLAAGCDEYAAKPIDRQGLIELVARHCQERKLGFEA